MNDPGIRAVLERLVADVSAEPDVADRAWTVARRQSRRVTVGAIGGAAAVGALAIALVGGSLARDRATAPITTPTVSTAPTTVHSSVPTPPAVSTVGPIAGYEDRLRAAIQPGWHDGEAATLPQRASALPATLEPFSGSAPGLTDDPVAHAVAVAQRTTGDVVDIRVLGDDGTWRTLDVPGLQPSFSDSTVVSLVNGEPISPDGTRLALPQPHALVVVDLTTGSSRRIALPSDGAPDWAGWSTAWSPDAREVVVGFGFLTGDVGAYAVDVESGVVRPVAGHPALADFAPDGSRIQIDNGPGGLGELQSRRDGEDGRTVVVGAQLASQRPAVGGNVVAVDRLVTAWTGSRSDPINQDGVLVVDRRDGEPVAYLPMAAPHAAESTELIGWLDADTLLMRVFVTDHGAGGDVLVAWRYTSGRLERVSSSWTFADGFDIAFAIDQV